MMGLVNQREETKTASPSPQTPPVGVFQLIFPLESLSSVFWFPSLAAAIVVAAAVVAAAAAGVSAAV